MDLLRHWNLSERPFEATWDTRFFHAGPDHEEALSRLLYLVSEKTMNLGLLTGEIGSGKTLTRAVFAGRIDATRFHVLTVENSGFQLDELLELLEAQLTSSEVFTALFELEMAGRVRCLPGKNYVRTM